MSKQFYFKQFSFSISTQFSSIWPIERTLSGATIPGESGLRNNGSKGVLHIPLSSCITVASPSGLFSVISRTLVGGVLPLCRDSISVFYSPQLTGPSKYMRQRDYHFDFDAQKSFFSFFFFLHLMLMNSLKYAVENWIKIVVMMKFSLLEEKCLSRLCKFKCLSRLCKFKCLSRLCKFKNVFKAKGIYTFQFMEKLFKPQDIDTGEVLVV